MAKARFRFARAGGGPQTSLGTGCVCPVWNILAQHFGNLSGLFVRFSSVFLC